MKRLIVVLLCVSAFASNTHAKVPPTLRNAPPGVRGVPDNAASRVPAAVRSFIPIDSAQARALPISDVLLPPSTGEGAFESLGATTEALPTSPEVGSPRTIATSSIGVEEPVTITINQSGIDKTSTAWIRRVSTSPFNVRNQYEYSGNGTVVSGTIGIPTGYTDSADPVLAENPYNAGAGPLNMYMGGITFNRAGNGGGANPSSVRVWTSTTGGYTWSSNGSEVDVNADPNSPVLLDKPWIEVSWHAGTLGYVYASWSAYNLTSPGSSEIRFRRSRNGVSRPRPICNPGPCTPTWDSMVTVATGNFIGAQIVVDGSGYVYVFWMSFGTPNQIMMVKSINAGAEPTLQGTVFGSPQVVASTPNAGDLGFYVMNNLIRAVTLPSARFNDAANRIMVAWHEKEPGSAKTDIWLAHKAPADASFSIVKLPGSTSGSDQFTPTLDNDESGNALVTYYDNYNVAAGYYRQTAQYITSTGVTAGGGTIAIGSNCYAGQLPTRRAVGEYQGLWRWAYGSGGTRWDTAWTCGSTTTPRTINNTWVK